MSRNKTALASVLTSIVLLSSCGGGGGGSAPGPAPILVKLSASTLKVLQDGTSASVDVTVTRPAGAARSVTLTVVTAARGLTTAIESPGAGNTGKVTFDARNTPAGSYSVTVRADDGVSSGTADLSLVVGIVATVGQPSGRRLQTFMSTSFQPASWTDQFFVQHPGATTPLDNLLARHINVQVMERDIPQTTATTWDFSYIDGILNRILSVADHSPLYQIARGPDFMYDDAQKLHLRDYQEFADFAANLVRYYNTGGFTDGQDVPHASSSQWPITYWGIYNEPNINGFSADEYVDMYNVVVPTMLAVDPTIKTVAVELADFGDEPQKYMPTFVRNVTAQVDVVATHFYSTCNQKDTDQQLFDSISGFAPHITYIYSQLQSRSVLADVPVWLTENNVNADWDNNGKSACDPSRPFVTDQRGTSAFFAAWRPTVFSKLGQAGIRALHHWGFSADAQYGEVSGTTSGKYLSYWVDYYLARYFPYNPGDPSSGSNILDLRATESSTVEILATQNSDGSVVVMIANHAVRSSTDNNGPGDPRTVVVDVSALGSFTTATLLMIDAKTNPAQGPSPTTITSPTSPVEITLDAYGVTFLTLAK